MFKPIKIALNTPQTIQTLLVMPQSTFWDDSYYKI